ncbi:MAG: hypothetical protein ACTJH9_08120 [Pseudoalteromonas sp.]|uniref:hypothetical protein n=1 Tax=unclassified Pseudoalteromonas TaxID=194690 RepID=UPI003F980F32
MNFAGIANEQLNLAIELTLKDKASDEIKVVRNNNTENDPINALLGFAVEIIRIITKNLCIERQSAQSLLG